MNNLTLVLPLYKPLLERFRQLTYDLKDQLVKLGYQEFTLEDVRDVVIEIIDNIRKEGDEKCLIENFCSMPYSEYFVAYLRYKILLILTIFFNNYFSL